MRPAPIWTALGPRSPADPVFDPFWARAAEAGITVVVHAGDSGYTTHGYVRDGFASSFDNGNNYKPSVKSFLIERAAYDFLITLSYEKLFERHPNCVASVENGSSSCRTCSANSSSRRTACPATTRRIRRRCSAPTSGSARSGRTTSTSWW
jgi:hypothetical protein